MKREPEIPKQLTAADLQLLEDKLKGWADQLERAREFLEAKHSELWVFKSNYLQVGMKSLTQFIASLDDSLIKAASGEPVNSSTRKTRKQQQAIAAEKKQPYKRSNGTK